MDVFFSYRRGLGDTPQAGRIRDFLADLGFEVFFDQDESVHPTGGLFHESILRSLGASRVVIALIGRSWVEQIARLHHPDDWVRAELRAAVQGGHRLIIPIYLGCTPDELSKRLPADVEFIEAVHTHLLWRHFEEPEKEQLQRLLADSLRESAIDVQRLRSLCAARVEDDILRAAGQKVVRELYVKRSAEDRLGAFYDEPERQRERMTMHLNVLQRIRNSDNTVQLAADVMLEIRQRILRSASAAHAHEDFVQLKRSFKFHETEKILQDIQVALTGDRAQMRVTMARALGALRQLRTLDAQELTDLRDLLEKVRITCEAFKRPPNLRELQGVHALLPSIEEDGQCLLASEAIKQLQLAAQTLDRTCLAVVDRAGRGKTNLLAHGASQLAASHPVIFFGGSALGAHDHGIEQVIQEWFDRQQGRPGRFEQWLPRVSKGLQQQDRWMYIAIDGINEAKEPITLARRLGAFLYRVQGSRIRLLLTCRDIFWDPLAHHLDAHLHGGRLAGIGDFSEREQPIVVAHYLQHYEIRAQLGQSAQRALSHPLLLRLFCETHRGQDLGFLETLRSTGVLDRYAESTTREVAGRLGLRHARSVEDLLRRIATRAWQARSSTVPIAATEMDLVDTERLDSVYAQLLSQGLLREYPSAHPTDPVHVGFAYDEVFEHFLASAWLQRLMTDGQTGQAVRTLVAEVGAALCTFPAAVGALLNLDQALERGGALANSLLEQLSECGDELLCTSQYALLQVVERTQVASLGDAAFTLLLRFEALAASAIRKRLGVLVLRLQQAQPHHPGVLTLVGRMLEVGTPVPDAAAAASVQSTQSTADETDLSRLPPVRFQYGTEVRLNAIALLIRGDDADRNMAADAMRSLGRVELSASLRAVEGVDGAADEVVLALIPSYLAEHAPEFRLYAAWLLRHRYGQAPADLLMQLLLDSSNRVRDFTRKLLRSRMVEPQLLQCLVVRLTSLQPLPDWSRFLLIDVLGYCAVNASGDSPEPSAVADTLLDHIASASQAVSVQAGRSLVAWQHALGAGHWTRLESIGNDVARRTLQRMQAG